MRQVVAKPSAGAPLREPHNTATAAAPAHVRATFQHNFANIAVSAASVPGVQAKLTVGRPDDDFEREADRVADRIVAMPVPAAARDAAPSSDGSELVVQRKCDCGSGAQAAGDEEDRGGAVDPSSLNNDDENQIDIGGGGAPLSPGARAGMESRFGFDFSGVRIHADDRADSLAAGLGARAFTVGSDIFFGRQQYEPESRAGQRLLAHELTHVVQQTQSGHSGSVSRLGEPRVQRYLAGPPERIATTTTTPAVYGHCRNFNTVVAWDTDVRNGFIVQECIRTNAITQCGGGNVPMPGTPHYYEAWAVDGTGGVSDGNADTWFNAPRPNTSGNWTFDSNVFAVHELKPEWGFTRGGVSNAGGLLSTATGPSHDDLIQPSLTRHFGGTWDCCDGKDTHVPM